jgi:tetratricopeptide (TPR) repeat protein
MLARMIAGLIRSKRPWVTWLGGRDREKLLVDARKLISLDRFEGAEQVLRELVQNGEDDAEAHRLLGTVLGATGRTKEAQGVLEHAHRVDPCNLDGLILLGNAYRYSGRYAEAEGCYRHALELDPSSRVAGFGVAAIAESLGRDEPAIRGYGSLLNPPVFVPALHALIALLLRLGQVEQAKSACAEVLRREPNNGAAHAFFGFLLLNRELRAQDALVHFESALRAGYRDNEVLANHEVARGVVLQDEGQPDAAVERYDAALRIQPDYSLARFHRALVMLLRGEFERGWLDYEARLMSGLKRLPPRELPRWKGESLPATTLLVYGEQGIGDEIMFASCLPDLVRRCPNIVLTCATKLVRIMRRSFPQIDILSSEEVCAGVGKDLLARASLMSPIGSLPLYLRPTVAHFPAHSGYLLADPVLVAKYRERLQSLGPGPKIGFSWRGGTVQSRRGLRSLGQDQIAALLHTTGMHFVNLQYDSAGNEPEISEATISGRLIHWPDALEDYDHTAALVSCLDGVASVCTAVIHLAGALGRPVWVMAPHVPEWRYGISGPRMPWYPAAEVIRQPFRGEWAPVIAIVRARLQALST